MTKLRSLLNTVRAAVHHVTPNSRKIKMNIISDDRLNELLNSSPAPRVTKDYIQSRIETTEFTKLDSTVTLCSITLDNGYSVRGESACVNPANYNKEIGERIAFDNAFRALWPLFGFLLAEKNLLSEQAEKTADEPNDKPKPEEKENEGLDKSTVKNIKKRIGEIHKDSGVASDVTNAVHEAIDDAIAA